MSGTAKKGNVSMTLPIPVVVRSHNDKQLIEPTLQMLEKQTFACEIHVFDNDSTDGTLDILPLYPVCVHRVPEGTYVPGSVLNEAMQSIQSSYPYVVFLNSDCTPVDAYWLENLIAGFSDDSVAAVFSRQMPRPDCFPLFAKDTEDTFGDGSRQKYWKHCFSMASSAIRRECWETMQFSIDIQYSEDIDWTWRARQKGWTIAYAAESKVYHSHNYTFAQFKKRQKGEGKADAQIFNWTRWERSFLRYSLLPYLRQVKSDASYVWKQKKAGLLPYSLALRFSQMVGRRQGFTEGLRKKDTSNG
ncbi:putative glycosyltransferase [Sphaerochaeta pleomorpha str. Grapes]|uniref:Putative glycosyltransferase n=1 Tax=Sphaerochaeta pleomorpha (strain ATCC BAA-1885 / DSM 22778 / Grapes) TaxID=158190 RepID=G8QSA1_SPHPG|nr:glycosyltransferase [Sphaerochaeta pleomorpha]AEV30031.1 putative glycosyltransferase [Sphaerochaeta pleomorpha str. Grapes]